MKKIKFNWGTGITLVILLFLISIVVRVYISSQYEINLTMPDYYQKGIKYQDIINKKNNAESLSEKPIVIERNDSVIIKFPDFFSGSELKGKILFFRPSDSHSDMEMIWQPEMKLEQIVSNKQFQKGKYIVKMDWNWNQKDYYLEQELIIQ